MIATARLPASSARERRNESMGSGKPRGAAGVPDALSRLFDRHLRGVTQQLREEALLAGLVVRNDHEGHPAIGRHPRQEALECRQATRGGTNAHDRERSLVLGSLLGRDTGRLVLPLGLHAGPPVPAAEERRRPA
jgi:hypothetical protein